MVGKKREMESKKDDFAVTILGNFFKSGIGGKSFKMNEYFMYSSSCATLN